MITTSFSRVSPRFEPLAGQAHLILGKVEESDGKQAENIVKSIRRKGREDREEAKSTKRKTGEFLSRGKGGTEEKERVQTRFCPRYS